MAGSAKKTAHAIRMIDALPIGIASCLAFDRAKQEKAIQVKSGKRLAGFSDRGGK
jgi:hypothetical protein